MSPEQQIDRSVLAGKDREELHTIAGAMGVKAATRMRKADLIEAILTAADGEETTNGETAEAPKSRRVRSTRAAEVGDDAIAALAEEEDALGASDASDDDAVPRPRVRVGVVTTPATAESPANGATATDDAEHATDVATPTRIDPEDERQSFGDGNRRSRRRRRGRGGQEQGGEPRHVEFQGEPVEVVGLLDLRDEGYGFLRAGGYLPGPKDVYVSASQVRRFALRKGDYVRGSSRPQASNEKYPALLRVDEINGMTPDDARNRPKFEDLTPLFPDSRLSLELADEPQEILGRIVDLISPIGKGQRGMIVSPSKAGKTTILKQFVHAVERNNPEVHLMVLLVDERPEEVTDMRRHVLRGEVVASTFDRPADEHTQVAELAIERAKRLVEMGTDVVIVLDGITRLARAYNLAAPTSGRIMSGGVDSTALYPPKKFFGAARNVEEGGSLTIIATALIESGSRMDEVIFEEFKGTGNMELRLDRHLAERRIYPAIDVEASSTRHEELLFDRQQLQQVWKLRRVLNALEEGKGLELLIDKIRTTKSNDEFLSEIAKAPTPGS
ncbi:MAG TPA: transcription termination factor Rho [Acidimicrobiia bacterium]|nr:transcription termination factor Rho [Acidimicrobiia bacterium]